MRRIGILGAIGVVIFAGCEVDSENPVTKHTVQLDTVFVVDTVCIAPSMVDAFIVAQFFVGREMRRWYDSAYIQDRWAWFHSWDGAANSATDNVIEFRTKGRLITIHSSLAPRQWDYTCRLIFNGPNRLNYDHWEVTEITHSPRL